MISKMLADFSEKEWEKLKNCSAAQCLITIKHRFGGNLEKSYLTLKKLGKEKCYPLHEAIENGDAIPKHFLQGKFLYLEGEIWDIRVTVLEIALEIYGEIRENLKLKDWFKIVEIKTETLINVENVEKQEKLTNIKLVNPIIQSFLNGDEEEVPWKEIEKGGKDKLNGTLTLIKIREYLIGENIERNLENLDKVIKNLENFRNLKKERGVEIN